jgi:hypothetical protein
MEVAVNAAGALPVLVCTGVLSVCWAIPQCLFVAELSSMFEVNGGFVVVRTPEGDRASDAPRFPSLLCLTNIHNTSLPACIVDAFTQRDMLADTGRHSLACDS